MQLILYQTLEDRGNPETVAKEGPFECDRANAWLGTGYYFWDGDISHAHWWGKTVYKKKGYIICSAKAVKDETCWDLHGDMLHLKEFTTICEEYAASSGIPLHELYVGEMIELLKQNNLLKYKAIRAYPQALPAGSTASSLQKFKLKFVKGKAFVLDLLPRIQVCLIEKRALSLNQYQIVYPANYAYPFA